ncbi:glycosyltransferase family 2 protein [Pandoraea fibrosis]|uniref:Glycosyltransferase 2-like domain-containing protein n=1 Tax=Pandoraea fibrosis TaxID=1891094 RepID=A0A5E4WEM8_9BURK|nr:glycosyltransferase [Pandoraea fibrosis]VVE21485.1 hypothetical protein PFI31113_03133 [Pandoraea fibrosis]
MNETMRPLLSIVIPTSNRQQYLFSVIEALLSITQAQVVVRDNSDQPLPETRLKPLLDSSRVIYAFDPVKVSVVENFERALSLAEGEYLMFIGDDDCVGPSVEAIAAWAKANAVEAVVSYTDRFIANYFWPGVRSKFFGDRYQGKLFFAPVSGKAEIIDTKRAISSAAARPGGGLRSMPRAYHGLVSRALVDEIIKSNGRLFGGVSPDIYSAVMISSMAKKAARIDYPFVLPGASVPSTAGEGAARQDLDDLRSRDHIKRFGPTLVWDDNVPEFYSPENVWTYSLQCALRDGKLSQVVINFPRLYIRAYFQYPGRREEIKRTAKRWIERNGYPQFFRKVLLGAFAECAQQVRRVWYRFVTPPKEVSELETVADAYRALAKITSDWHPPTR